MSQPWTSGERATAQALIRAILTTGHTISVWDGGATTLRYAKSPQTILQSLCTTEEDVLRLHDASRRPVGFFRLIYGNDPDGSELIADHSDNALCESIAAALEQDPSK